MNSLIESFLHFIASNGNTPNIKDTFFFGVFFSRFVLSERFEPIDDVCNVYKLETCKPLLCSISIQKAMSKCLVKFNSYPQRRTLTSDMKKENCITFFSAEK